MIILKSSDPKGVCYVETKNLDGETNMKMKTTHKELKAALINDKDVTDLSGEITCERPNNAIYKFEGTLKIPSVSNQLSIGPENLLLRGSSVRNTDYVYGVVVFAGHETKVMMNS
jgi:phospholipid-transporting ATPase